MTGFPKKPRAAGVVVAAGKGLRSGMPLPKQFAPWRGKPLLRHSVEALLSNGIAPVVVVVPEGADDVAEACLDGLEPVCWVTGGRTRQISVLAGLEALVAHAPSNVLIHDAARPFVVPEVIDRLVAALEDQDAAIPVLPIVDSILYDDAGMMGEPADRDVLRRVQTPQAFHFDAIIAAHREWAGEPEAGDDAQVARAAGIPVALVEGDEAMRKMTYAADFDTDAPAVRIGTGFDVHRLESGEDLWLCGVKIDHDKGLSGHSDADVALHALVDAMLGAIGAGDIGQHFPPGDDRWRGAPSDRFVAEATRIVTDRGYRVGNADITIICESPKIGPHREAMRNRLGEILGVDIAALNVKATTTERLGFTGRGEGIAAHAVVSLVRS